MGELISKKFAKKCCNVEKNAEKNIPVEIFFQGNHQESERPFAELNSFVKVVLLKLPHEGRFTLESCIFLTESSKKQKVN